ncbi:DUF4255 domain-containing protein [Streptomyces sp. NPDC018833]|uniref:DUF4255 domain-containing protein n=1 Tax=Streptomyces sp. NPDC018833 TaxID=3365053 RepID=UPI0037990F0E
MSDALAVAAATETLRVVLQDAVGRTLDGTIVTARPPDEAAAGAAGAVLNLFLYRMTVDGAWRNTDPVGARPGETHRPPIPLVLHYMVTAYGTGGDDHSAAHRLLGAAMAAFHDRPVLRPADIGSAAGFSDLHLQQEPVRISPAVMSTEEMCRLWTALGARYRPSVAYEARVVLIDSSVPGRAPLPVVRRGAEGRGPEAAAATTVGAWPELHALTPAVAAPGAGLVLTGGRLDAGLPSVRLTHPLLGGPVVLPARAVGATQVRATLPDDHAAGRWSVVVVLTAPDGSERTTRSRPLDVMPRITGRLPMTAARDGDGTVTLKVGCTPQVHPGQRVELLVGDLPVPVEPVARATRTLRVRFRSPHGRPGRYALRLRVDGVDSPLTGTDAEQLDADTAVEVT